MAPRKTGSIQSDPEKATPTVAKALNPLKVDDPEKANPTHARASNPLKRRSLVKEHEDDEPTNPNPPDEDPERENRTSTRARPVRPKKDNPRSSAVEVSQSLQDEGDSDYHTGQNFRSMHDQDDDGAKIEGVKKEGGSDLDKKKRGMSRLRMRRAGKGGKLTKNGLDMQSFYKTKICPYLLAVIF